MHLETNTPSLDNPELWIPAPKVAQQFRITRRTLGRWIRDKELNFPKPTVLNHRLYFLQSQIENWKFERSYLSTREAA